MDATQTRNNVKDQISSHNRKYRSAGGANRKIQVGIETNRSKSREYIDLESFIDDWTKPNSNRCGNKIVKTYNKVIKDRDTNIISYKNPFEIETDDVLSDNVKGRIEPVDCTNPFEEEIIIEAKVYGTNPFEEDTMETKDNDINPFEQEDIMEATNKTCVRGNPFEDEVEIEERLLFEEQHHKMSSSYNDDDIVTIQEFNKQSTNLDISDAESHKDSNVFDDHSPYYHKEEYPIPNPCKNLHQIQLDESLSLACSSTECADSVDIKDSSQNQRDQFVKPPQHPKDQLSNTNTAGDSGDIVLVTGGNGFLGQHIIKLLQLKAPHVKEIRVLDKVPFSKKLDYESSKPVKILRGNIKDKHFVKSSVRGVTSVLHIAGLVSFGTFPDIEGMKEVNVKGTQNIVNACLAESSVSRLIYCSTVDVVVGQDPIRGGNEDSPQVPQDFLFPGYPETKYQGEQLVLRASQYPRKHGSHLQTLALRANVMYGELDPFYVTSGLKMAKQRKGILNQIGDGSAMFQQAYVGNTAWAFVCADCAMRDTPDLTSKFFYIPDHTPIQNSFNFMRPYLEARGFQLSEDHISYNLVYGAVYAAEKFAKAVSPLKKLNLPTQSCSISYINMDLYFRGDRARDILKYEPLFSPADARLVSLKYYNKVELY